MVSDYKANVYILRIHRRHTNKWNSHCDSANRLRSEHPTENSSHARLRRAIGIISPSIIFNGTTVHEPTVSRPFPIVMDEMERVGFIGPLARFAVRDRFPQD